MNVRVTGGLLGSPPVFIGIAILFRLFVVFTVGETPVLIDMEEYHELAVSVLEGRGYASDHGPTAFRPPLYPLFISGIYAVTGSPNIHAVRIVQAILGGVEVWLLWRVASLWFGSAVAVGASWILALYPTRLIYATFIHRETLLGVLWLWQVYAFYLLTHSRPRFTMYLSTALAVSLGILCNAVLLATTAVLSIFLLIGSLPRGGDTYLRRFGMLSIVWLGAIIFILPWSIRNHRALGEWVWVNTKGGRALWEGNNPGWMEGRAEMEIRSEQWKAMSGMNEVESDRFAREQAIWFIRRHPDQFAYLTWRRIMQFWKLELLPFFYYKQGFFGILAPVILIPCAIIVLSPFPLLCTGAAAGLVSRWSDRHIRLIAALMSVHCLASSVFIGGFRYHFPLIPVLACLAVLGWKYRGAIRGRRLVVYGFLFMLLYLNFLDHIVANWNQVRALMGKGGRYEYSDTRSWMKKGIF